MNEIIKDHEVNFDSENPNVISVGGKVNLYNIAIKIESGHNMRRKRTTMTLLDQTKGAKSSTPVTLEENPVWPKIPLTNIDWPVNSIEFSFDDDEPYPISVSVYSQNL